MKKSLFCVFALFLAAGCASTKLPTKTEAEIPSKEAFKGANVLYVPTRDAPEAARSSIIKTMQGERVSVAESRTDENTIVTEPTGVSSGAARYRVTFTDTDSTRLMGISGEVISNSANDTNTFEQYPASTVAPTGSRRSAVRNAWWKMESIAELYADDNGTDVYYGKQ